MLDFNAGPIGDQTFRSPLTLPALVSFAIFCSIFRGWLAGDRCIFLSPSWAFPANDSEFETPGAAHLGGAGEARTGWKSP
jgi:hypothetical protein